jgi:long-subunit fatty acid transport protein
MCSSLRFAAGFRLPERIGGHGRQAFVGQADNLSAVWYNRAGITQLDGTMISGALLEYSGIDHENTNGTTDVSKRICTLPPSLRHTS